MTTVRTLIALAALLVLASPLRAQADGALLERRRCDSMRPYEEVEELARARRREPPPETEYRRLQRGAVCERLTYSSDGLRVVAIMVRPTRTAGKRLPVLIFNHGSGADGALPEQVQLDQAHWVANGYLYIAPQYRGGGGSEGRDEYGGADAHDVTNLYPLLRRIPYADTANIFMWGHSRGGTMTFLALRAGMPVRAAAVTATLADYTGWPHSVVASMPDSARRVGVRQRSAVAWPEQIRAPVLMLHGDADRIVPLAPMRRLATQLDSLGRPHELVVYPGGDHNLTGHGDDVHRRIREWFARYRGRP
ncbi:MAG TPA: prolyl oligopeptidase family serine peptidase [Longimicrobium sp.]|jgi:dipeptidyl aminopeptidase/acylaminoacyl peptidase